MIGTVLFTKNNRYGFYGRIAGTDGETYYFDTSCVAMGTYKKGSRVEFDVGRIEPGRTIAKAVNVRNYYPDENSRSSKDNDLQQEFDTTPIGSTVIESLRTKALQEGFIYLAQLPDLLSQIGVDYKQYAPTLSLFIEKYFSKDFEKKTNVTIAGKNVPAILVVREHKEESINQKSTDEKGNADIPSCNDQLVELIKNKQYEEFLRSDIFLTSTPNQLGPSGILLAVQAVAGFLGDDTNISLNDFQRALIEAEHTVDLLGLKNDEEILNQGMRSAFIPMSLDAFRANFASICYGKNNFNVNWNDLVERFWAAKNDLAFYLNAIWLIVFQKEKCVSYYIDEGVKDKKISRIGDLLLLWKSFSKAPGFAIPLRLKRKIIGNCLDCGCIDALVRAIGLFDYETMPEIHQLSKCLSGETSIDSNTLFGCFQSEIEPLISEKLVNLFWYRESDKVILSEMVIRTLSSICWDYEARYLDSVLYNNTYPEFDLARKATVLLQEFPNICNYARTYRKAYLLANYIYNNLLGRFAHKVDISVEIIQQKWSELQEWMINQVKSFLSSDMNSVSFMAVFKYDELTSKKIAAYYGETFIIPRLKQCANNDERNEAICQYKKTGIAAINQWIATECHNTSPESVNNYLQAQQFTDALIFVQNQHELSIADRKKALRTILCENYKTKGFDEEANDVLRVIPANVAETILLEGLAITDDDAIEALFAIYAHESNWLKIAYLYAPCNATRRNYRPAVYENVKRILNDNNIDVKKTASSHLDVLKTAIRVLNSNEFDKFVDWAKRIQIPYGSKQYYYKSKPFDAALKNFLSSSDNSLPWNQLLLDAIRSDNYETQDMQRFSIITSYIGRFGLSKFEQIISNLAKTKQQGKDFYGYYNSIWKGLFTGKYSYNIFDLSLPLIKEAPLTYWNLFYETAVCKNNVFSLEALWGEQWHTPTVDLQSFYSALVEQYAENRETVFLQLAIKLLEQYPDKINPEFDKYLSYCNSKKSKDYLLNAFVHILEKGKYMDELKAFLQTDCWFTNDSESKLISILALICESNYQYFNEQLGLCLADEYWYDCFVSDFLASLFEYPKIDVVSVIQRRSSSQNYKYQLIKTVFQIVFDEAQLESLENAGLITAPRTTDGGDTIRCYCEMMDVYYRKQLQRGSVIGSVWLYKRWVQNRYHRILAIDYLTNHDSENNDENILILMRSNKHFSDSYNNYKEFKKGLDAVVNSKAIHRDQKTVVLLSIISNHWQEFIDHISEYDRSILCEIGSMMALSNYRELNLQLLERYLLVLHSDYSEENIQHVASCSSKLGSILTHLYRLKKGDPTEHERTLRLLVGICRLTNQGSPYYSYVKLDYALGNYYNELTAHWELFMSALQLTCYDWSIVSQFGKDIRNTAKRCTQKKIELWEPVFRSLFQLPAYYYLCAVWYAIERKKTEAQESYFKITSYIDFPVEWNQERKELEDYLEGRISRFVANSRNTLAHSSETEARDLAFIISAATQKKRVEIEAATEAYIAILSPNSSEKLLDAYKSLFAYIRNPDNLYDIYKQVDSRKDDFPQKTYNELVIGYGSLLIVDDPKTFSHDEKLKILINLMDVFELLSDLNKERPAIRQQLKEAESYVLGTPGLSLNAWLNNYQSIKTIISHDAIGNPKKLISDLLVPVEQCLQHIAVCESQMQIIDWLTEWRKTWTLTAESSDYERAFIKSVDAELSRLSGSPQMNVTIVNECNILEDGVVYYEVENLAGKSTSSVVLNNLDGQKGAKLEVVVGIEGSAPVKYDNPSFDCIVELRPGDICGQSYQLPSGVYSALHEGERIEVILNILVDGTIICNNRKDNRQLIFRSQNDKLLPSVVSPNTKYETAVPAFSGMIRGFGRDREKKEIRELLKQHLLIIYGPSRVGKSSLMNYINNEYVLEYQKTPQNRCTSVLTVSIADERNKRDYSVNMETDAELSKFGNTDWVFDYLFLSPLKIALDSCNPLKQNRRRKIVGEQLPNEIQNKLKSILTLNGSVQDKLSLISSELVKNHCELWLLYDEFQQVVDKWPELAMGLAELCGEIKYGMEGIKLVLCGSDDLLRLFECENDPKWDAFKIGTAENSISIGQLELDDFTSMMEDERIWLRAAESKPFSGAALKLLHQYTGGNAICGKLFGNEILKRLRNGAYSNRSKVYPSDITSVAYSLLSSSEVGSVRNQLIAHNNKNLEKEKKYLLFIAHELAYDTNRSYVTIEMLREFFASRSLPEINMAIKILIARGILKTGTTLDEFGFTTMFYYDFFKSQATDSVIELLRENETPSDNPARERNPLIVLRDDFKNLPEDDRTGAIHLLYGSLSSEGKESVRESFGDIVKGAKIGTQYNTQIVNNIVTAFNILLNGDVSSASYLQAFSQLPSVRTFIPESSMNLLQEKIQTMQDSNDEGAQAIAEREAAELIAPAEQGLTGAYIAAASNSMDFFFVPEERWPELIHVDRKTLETVIPPEFFSSLGFTVMLHSVFEAIRRKASDNNSAREKAETELDYCPVAIMYCKLVEAMLKELHTPIYVDRIGKSATLDRTNKYFCQLKQPDGEIDINDKDLTIGSFAFNIVITNKKNNIDDPGAFFRKEKRSEIHAITGCSKDYEPINQMWYKHARSLAVINAIRNKSAHQAAPITRENFEWLVEELFDGNELARIADLSRKNYPCQ